MKYLKLLLCALALIALPTLHARPAPPGLAPTIATNIQDGDTVTFDAGDLLLFDATCHAAQGQTMGVVSLHTSWGLDTEGDTSGETQVEGGTFLFLDPYYPPGLYTVEVTAIDEAGHISSRIITFHLVY